MRSVVGFVDLNSHYLGFLIKLPQVTTTFHHRQLVSTVLPAFVTKLLFQLKTLMLYIQTAVRNACNPQIHDVTLVLDRW